MCARKLITLYMVLRMCILLIHLAKKERSFKDTIKGNNNMNWTNKSAWKQLIAIIICFNLISQLFFYQLNFSESSAEENINLNLNVKSAILIDANSADVMYEYNADEVLPPASMAKMMTEYLILEQISNGKLKWDDMVATSEYASQVIGSGQLLAKGEKLSVLQMFEALSIYSANDASVALAEYISGSEENFAKMMNNKAQEMGLSEKAHFISATGLSRVDLGIYAPKEITGETIMTARDVANLAYRLIHDHKEILKHTSITSKKLRETDKNPMINWNWMLEGNKDITNFKKFAYVGLDGLKTGHTTEAGYCFTGTAERNGLRLISVVMGTTSEPQRFEETRKLLDYGFNNFEIRTIIKSGSEIDSLKSVPIRKGIETLVSLNTKEDLSFLVDKRAKDDDFQWKTITENESKLVAPIAIGDKLGTLYVSYKGKEKSVDLIATKNIEKAGILRLMFRSIKELFSNLFTSIKNLF